MKSFENIPPNQERPDRKKRPSQKKMTRRDFLIGLGAVAGTAVVGKKIMDLAEEKESDDRINAKLKEVEERIRLRNEMTQEQEKIQEADKDVVGKTFSEQILTQDHITIDAGTKKAIYVAWREKYSPGGAEHETSLLIGLERMRPWITEIRDIFKKYEIPEEYMYLGIAESHFLNDAVSYVKAVGPYQVMEDTARSLNPEIIIDQDIDQRRDPLVSAELCAKHLRRSYDRFGDWDLALMDYNGGFTNWYEKERDEKEHDAEIISRTTHTITEGERLTTIAQKYNTSVTLLKRANNLKTSKQIRSLQIGQSLIIPQEKESLTLEGFNAFLEHHINGRIKNALEGPDYIINKGDTIGTIAQRFGISQEILRNANNLENNDIKAGEGLHIPGAQEKKRQDLIKVHLHNYQQNINYPEKFHAIRDVIKNFRLDESFSKKEPTYKMIRTKAINPAVFYHKLRSGETIYSMSQKITSQLNKEYPQTNFSSSVISRLLAQQNNISDPRLLQIGHKFRLEIPVQKPATLHSIASQNNLPTESLKKLNPSISSIYTPLPPQFSVRIPK